MKIFLNIIKKEFLKKKSRLEKLVMSWYLKSLDNGQFHEEKDGELPQATWPSFLLTFAHRDTAIPMGFHVIQDTVTGRAAS